jgi:hypothetical protein
MFVVDWLLKVKKSRIKIRIKINIIYHLLLTTNH